MQQPFAVKNSVGTIVLENQGVEPGEAFTVSVQDVVFDVTIKNNRSEAIVVVQQAFEDVEIAPGQSQQVTVVGAFDVQDKKTGGPLVEQVAVTKEQSFVSVHQDVTGGGVQAGVGAYEAEAQTGVEFRDFKNVLSGKVQV